MLGLCFRDKGSLVVSPMTWFELPRRSRSSKEDDHVVLRGEMGQRKTKKVEVRNDNGIKRW